MIREFVCLNCKEKFTKNQNKPYKFCSHICRGNYKSKNNHNKGFVPCEYCGQSLWRENLKTKKHIYCNNSCQLNYEYKNNLRDLKGIHKTHDILRNKANEKLKKGHKYFNRMMSSDGYWRIYVPLSGWNKEHIYLWEKENGKLPKGYEIHHINHNKLDNDLNNLKLLTKSEHTKEHYKTRDICKITGRFLKEK